MLYEVEKEAMSHNVISKCEYRIATFVFSSTVSSLSNQFYAELHEPNVLLSYYKVFLSLYVSDLLNTVVLYLGTENKHKKNSRHKLLRKNLNTYLDSYDQ